MGFHKQTTPEKIHAAPLEPNSHRKALVPKKTKLSRGLVIDVKARMLKVKAKTGHSQGQGQGLTSLVVVVSTIVIGPSGRNSSSNNNNNKTTVNIT